MNVIDVMKILKNMPINVLLWVVVAVVFYTAVSFLVDYARSANINRADNKRINHSDEELSEEERIEKERRKWYFLPH